MKLVFYFDEFQTETSKHFFLQLQIPENYVYVQIPKK